MTLPAALAAIGWTRPELARRLGVNTSTVANWVKGRHRTPPDVLDWLDAVARGVNAWTSPKIVRVVPDKRKG